MGITVRRRKINGRFHDVVESVNWRTAKIVKKGVVEFQSQRSI